MNILDQIPPRVRPTYCTHSARNSDVDAVASELLTRYRSDISPALSNPEFDSRFVRASLFLLPFISQIPGLENKRALEIGCGTGAKSFALAPLFSEYVGIDIVKGEIETARNLCGKFKAENVDFRHDEAADIEQFLGKEADRFDVIILYAVLEHLTIEEKIGVLRICWDYLDDDGFLFIGETPNRMHPVDYHSSKLLYFQQMPLDLWKRYYRRSPNGHWKQSIASGIENNNLEKTAFRRGLHVGHQEFDLALMDVELLAPHVLSDGYFASILNLYPYDKWEFLKLMEFSELRGFPDGVMIEPRSFPDFFSRYYLEALLRKRELGEKSCRPVRVIAPRRKNYKLSNSGIGNGMELKSGDRITLSIEDMSEEAGDWVQVSICVFKPALSKGKLSVSDKYGNIIFQEKLQKLMLSIGKWRAHLTFELPKIPRNAFPIELFPDSRSVFTVEYIFIR